MNKNIIWFVLAIILIVSVVFGTGYLLTYDCSVSEGNITIVKKSIECAF